MSQKKTKPKKVRSLFFRDKAVVSEKKKLNKLKKQRKLLIENIKEIIATYNNKSLDIQHSSEWLERFPIQSLQDLYQFLAGTKESSISILKLRSKLRNEHNKKVEDTFDIDKEICICRVDLLLAKINCVQSKLD